MPGGNDQQIADVPPVQAPLNAPSNSSFAPGLPANTEVSTVSTESASSNDRAVITINEDTRQQLKEAEGQVNRLMLEHAQNSAQNTQQGVLPLSLIHI